MKWTHSKKFLTVRPSTSFISDSTELSTSYFARNICTFKRKYREMRHGICYRTQLVNTCNLLQYDSSLCSPFGMWWTGKLHCYKSGVTRLHGPLFMMALIWSEVLQTLQLQLLRTHRLIGSSRIWGLSRSHSSGFKNDQTLPDGHSHPYAGGNFHIPLRTRKLSHFPAFMEALTFSYAQGRCHILLCTSELSHSSAYMETFTFPYA
jgi:hypothetical protein